MVIDPDELIKVIQKIRTDRNDWKQKKRFLKFNENDFINYVKKEHEIFVKKAPGLFEKITSGDLDNPQEMVRLIHMIDRMRAIKNQETTLEDESKIIGQKYADEFVKPLVDKLDKEREEEEK
jgi:hypothetical protein